MKIALKCGTRQLRLGNILMNSINIARQPSLSFIHLNIYLENGADATKKQTMRCVERDWSCDFVLMTVQRAGGTERAIMMRATTTAAANSRK